MAETPNPRLFTTKERHVGEHTRLDVDPVLATDITLLDLFAGMVATAKITAHRYPIPHVASMTGEEALAAWAQDSYTVAQALLDERARRRGEG